MIFRSWTGCVRLVAVGCLWVLISGCSAQEVAVASKLECIGRLQIAFPTDVDVAAFVPTDRSREGFTPEAMFLDGEPALWSDLGYLGGVRVAGQLDQVSLKQLLTQRMKVREKFRAVSLAGDFVDRSVKLQSGFGFDAQNRAHLTVAMGSTVVLWSGYSGLSALQREQDYLVLVRGLRERKIFSVPAEIGVCLPFAFIRDDGIPRRHIATTYRLKAHPDITIMLRDATAARVDPKADPHVYDPKAKSDDFWARYDSAYRKSLRSVWSTPYKQIKLAGSVGVESFVKIVREDGSEDYGYLAVGRGDPDAEIDTPDLMLYVIQNSKKAKAQGVTPLDKDAVLKMAQTIAASVKRRPTSP
jgi:Tle cognate immunity protein 4 C-terminal domain